MNLWQETDRSVLAASSIWVKHANHASRATIAVVQCCGAQRSSLQSWMTDQVHYNIILPLPFWCRQAHEDSFSPQNSLDLMNVLML